MGKRKHRRGAATLTISIIALVISIVATGVSAYPLVTDAFAQQANSLDFVSDLVSTEINAALNAGQYAERGSDAETFAGAIQTLWRADTRSASERAAMTQGTVEQTGSNSYKLCFPPSDVNPFSSQCWTAEHFVFSDENLVVRFSLGGAPISSLMHDIGSSTLLTDDDQPGPVKIYSLGTLTSPDAQTKAVLLFMTRMSQQDRQYPVSFRQLIVQDQDETELAVKYKVPLRIGYWAYGYGVVTGSLSIAYMNFCWDGVTDDRSSCDWAYHVP